MSIPLQKKIDRNSEENMFNYYTDYKTRYIYTMCTW